MVESHVLVRCSVGVAAMHGVWAVGELGRSNLQLLSQAPLPCSIGSPSPATVHLPL